MLTISDRTPPAISDLFASDQCHPGEKKLIGGQFYRKQPGAPSYFLSKGDNATFMNISRTVVRTNVTREDTWIDLPLFQASHSDCVGMMESLFKFAAVRPLQTVEENNVDAAVRKHFEDQDGTVYIRTFDSEHYFEDDGVTASINRGPCVAATLGQIGVYVTEAGTDRAGLIVFQSRIFGMLVKPSKKTMWDRLK